MYKVIQFYIAYTNLLNTVKDNRLSAKGNGKKIFVFRKVSSTFNIFVQYE